jgi:hypothetical protein
LRQNLIWQRNELNGYFHAAEDKQVVRNAVFETILAHKFEVQATRRNRKRDLTSGGRKLVFINIHGFSTLSTE